MSNYIGQRQLAAIVFTDVAGFSAKAESDEERTLRRVKGDLESLRSMVEARKGKIIKTTGDGLLISFSSAVDAVSFAIEAQRTFSAKNEKLPPAERLEHRMGIHLGDIFISESEAMGDGVNVAARIQAEAEPGGICISQTVYDVVKNKLAVRVVSIGPRELKNIRDAIHVYRIVVDAERSLARRERRPAGRLALVPAVIIGILCVALVLMVSRGKRLRAGHVVMPAVKESVRPGKAAVPGGAPQGRMEVMRERLKKHGPANPLVMWEMAVLEPGSGAPGTRKVSVWMEGDDVMIRSGDRIFRRKLEELMPRARAAIAGRLALEEELGTAPRPAAASPHPAPRP